MIYLKHLLFEITKPDLLSIMNNPEIRKIIQQATILAHQNLVFLDELDTTQYVIKGSINYNYDELLSRVFPNHVHYVLSDDNTEAAEKLTEVLNKQETKWNNLTTTYNNVYNKLLKSDQESFQWFWDTIFKPNWANSYEGCKQAVSAIRDDEKKSINVVQFNWNKEDFTKEKTYTFTIQTLSLIRNAFGGGNG